MVLKSFILFFIFIVNVKLVRCECDSYSNCVGSFISNFFSNVNYFTNVNNNELNNTSEFSEDDINSILVNVSSFLQNEWENNETIASNNIFQNINNDTSIFVRAINIGDDIDLYNNIFFENQTFEIPSDINIKKINFPDNASSVIQETISFKKYSSVLQPLVFNFSEILTPVNFSVSLFPQIKIEHFQSTNEKDQRLNEISDNADFQEYYDFNEDNSTDYPIIDYIDLYKDTTNEIIESNPTERYGNKYNIEVTENNKHVNEDSLVEVKTNEDKGFIDFKDNVKELDITKVIFPWIAAIFIKNDTSDQYNYYCDGALLSDKIIVTAARCIQSTNLSVNADDIIVVLGKKSLQTMSENERVEKVESVHVHENFTNGPDNDVAILTLEDAVEFSESIQPARLGNLKEYDEAFTTGWAFTGELTLINFEKGNKSCDQESQGHQTFCATYGNDVTVCPSYGGLYVVEKNDTWYLQGLRTADPTDRVVCVNRPIIFTALEFSFAWLSNFIS